MEKEVKYPIGQQDFKTLRKLGYVYVDKTSFVYKITRGSQYLFLARPRRFDNILNGYFSKWEDEYDVTTPETELSLRFRNIIEAAHRKTGHQVAILVDEYDKPLVGNLNKIENLILRMAGGYSKSV